MADYDRLTAAIAKSEALAQDVEQLENLVGISAKSKWFLCSDGTEFKPLLIDSATATALVESALAARRDEYDQLSAALANATKALP